MKKNKKNKNQKHGKPKEGLRERFRFGDVEVPACVHAQTMRIYLIAGIVVFFGCALMVLNFDIFILIGTIVVGLAIAGIGYYREYKISKDGYVVIDGECVKVEYSTQAKIANIATRGDARDVPSRFIINSEDGVFAIPYFKQNAIIQEEDRVKLYLKNDVQFLEVRGALTPDSILGYEVYY